MKGSSLKTTSNARRLKDTQHTHAANHTQVRFLQSSSAVWFDKILGRTHGWPFYPCWIRLLCEHPAACNQATALLKRPQVCLWAPRELRGVENVTNVSVLRHTDFTAGELDLLGPVQTGCPGWHRFISKLHISADATETLFSLVKFSGSKRRMLQL